jgi:hypothetical protein
LPIGGMAMRKACGQDHVPHPLESAQRDGVGGLGLTPRDRLDRAADDLGDVAGRVDHEREEQGEERRIDPDAAHGLTAGERRQRPLVAECDPPDQEHDEECAGAPQPGPGECTGAVRDR